MADLADRSLRIVYTCGPSLLMLCLSVVFGLDVRKQRSRGSVTALVVVKGGIAQWPEFAAGGDVGQDKGVAAEHVDVHEAERRQAAYVCVVHLDALGE